MIVLKLTGLDEIKQLETHELLIHSKEDIVDVLLRSWKEREDKVETLTDFCAIELESIEDARDGARKEVEMLKIKINSLEQQIDDLNEELQK